MTGNVIQSEKARQFRRELTQLRDAIAVHERELEQMRNRRNMAIVGLKNEEGTYQVELAKLAGVGQSYIQRVLAFDGKPPAGYRGSGARKRARRRKAARKAATSPRARAGRRGRQLAGDDEF